MSIDSFSLTLRLIRQTVDFKWHPKTVVTLNVSRKSKSSGIYVNYEMKLNICIGYYTY